MIISSQTWLRCAAKLMPRRRDDWLAAMKIELEQVSNPSDQNKFAFGCFNAAMLEALRSRKGLSYLARVGGASLLFAFSTVALLWSTKDVSQPETLAFAKIIIVLCLSYMGGAALLMASLRGLKIYTAIGFGITALGWGYFNFVRPTYEHLSTELLMAVSIEAAFVMAVLFMAGVYLNWLYDPSIHDA